MTLDDAFPFIIPEVIGASRPKAQLDILIAHSTLTDDELRALAKVQFLNWHLVEIEQLRESKVTFYVSGGDRRIREAFSLVTHRGLDGFDQTSAEMVAQAAVNLDCDVILTDVPNEDVLAILDVEQFHVVTDVQAVLAAAEHFAHGFEVPWRVESPAKHQPWTSFYQMSDRRTFDPLMEFESRAVGSPEDAREAMRVLIHNTLPNLLFSRDRLAFFQMQQRYARRMGLERQNFLFEYAYHLNHFYLTLGSAMDQVAIMVNAFLKLGFSDETIGATTSAFRKALEERCSPVYEVFDDKSFWQLMDRVKMLRHQAAHRQPLMPTTVYEDPEREFTDEELDAVILERGWNEDIRLAPDFMKLDVLNMVRYKARLSLLKPLLEHAVYVKYEGKVAFVYPFPEGNLNEFMEFLLSVLRLMPVPAN